MARISILQSLVLSGISDFSIDRALRISVHSYMAEGARKFGSSAIQEIHKKFRLVFFIITFVIFTLFAVIIKYHFGPLSEYLSFIPELSFSLIVGILFCLTVIGIYLSIVISRQVIRIITDYSHRLERILTITSELREEVHGDILLEKILDAAISITRSDAGSLLMLEGENLVFKILKGDKASNLVGVSVNRNKGIAGWVAKNGTAVRIADTSKDKRFNSEIDALTGYETKSILCVPLKTKAGVLGVLELLNREEHPYRERDEEIITHLAEQAAISIATTQFIEDQRNYEIHVTEMLLEAMDFQIPDKKGHSRRVARYGNILAKSLNMSEDEKKRLYFASLLHDVGFLRICADDAFKREEFTKHPVVGYEMIRPINFYSEIAPFILHHHERYDGFGYPSQLKGEGIPIEARIISISEAFDVMVSPVSYKVPLSFAFAAEELKKNAGTQFDPELVELFLSNIEAQHTKI